MSFNLVGLGSTLVIQKAYKVQDHTLVFCNFAIVEIFLLVYILV